jgi:predicted patatin/cPLA2 family phospholipase
MPDVKKALVVEGGGMRGIFAAGVLDEFLQEKFNPFHLFIGVSAGAVSLASYLSGQYQRYYRLSSGPMKKKEFISFKRFLAGGHFMDLDWLWSYASTHDPLDVKMAVCKDPREFLIGVTDVHTGNPLFIRPDASTLLNTLLASSALPVMYRGFVKLEGRLVADGGVADPLPVKEAYLRGARNIVVIRTRPANRSKGWFFDSLMATLCLRGYPALSSRIRKLHRVYKEAEQFIHKPPYDSEVFEITPPPQLRSARLRADYGTLKADYELGRQAGRHFVEHEQKMNMKQKLKIAKELCGIEKDTRIQEKKGALYEKQR